MKVFGYIVVIKRSGVDYTSFPLTTTNCSIGRNQECDIRVQLPTVSKQHCLIRVDSSGTAHINNSSLSHPTLLNNKSLENKEENILKHNDIICIADRLFRWEYPEGSRHKENLINFASKKSPLLTTPLKRKKSSPSKGSTKRSIVENLLLEERGKRVSFGPYLSPEQYDKKLPPSTPIRKGQTPLEIDAEASLKKAMKIPRFSLQNSSNPEEMVSSNGLLKRKSPTPVKPKLAKSLGIFIGTKSKSPVNTPLKSSAKKTNYGTQSHQKNSTESSGIKHLSGKGLNNTSKKDLKGKKRKISLTGSLSPSRKKMKISTEAQNQTPQIKKPKSAKKSSKKVKTFADVLKIGIKKRSLIKAKTPKRSTLVLKRKVKSKGIGNIDLTDRFSKDIPNSFNFGIKSTGHADSPAPIIIHKKVYKTPKVYKKGKKLTSYLQLNDGISPDLVGLKFILKSPQKDSPIMSNNNLLTPSKTQNFALTSKKSFRSRSTSASPALVDKTTSFSDLKLSAHKTPNSASKKAFRKRTVTPRSKLLNSSIESENGGASNSFAIRSCKSKSKNIKKRPKSMPVALNSLDSPSKVVSKSTSPSKKKQNVRSKSVTSAPFPISTDETPAKVGKIRNIVTSGPSRSVAKSPHKPITVLNTPDKLKSTSKLLAKARSLSKSPVRANSVPKIATSPLTDGHSSESKFPGKSRSVSRSPLKPRSVTKSRDSSKPVSRSSNTPRSVSKTKLDPEIYDQSQSVMGHTDSPELVSRFPARSKSMSKSPDKSKSVSKSPGRSKSIIMSPDIFKPIKLQGRSKSVSGSHSLSNSPDKPKSMSKSSGRCKSLSKLLGQSKSIAKSPGRSKSISKSPGRPKSISKSPGRSKSISKSPGRPKSISKSPGRPKSISKSPRRSSLSKSPGRSSQSKSPGKSSEPISPGISNSIIISMSPNRSLSLSNSPNRPKSVLKSPSYSKSVLKSPRKSKSLTECSIKSKSVSRSPYSPKSAISTPIGSPSSSKLVLKSSGKSVMTPSTSKLALTSPGPLNFISESPSSSVLTLSSSKSSGTPKSDRSKSISKSPGRPRSFSYSPIMSKSASKSQGKSKSASRSQKNPKSSLRSLISPKSHRLSASKLSPGTPKFTLKLPGTPKSVKKSLGTPKSVKKSPGAPKSVKKSPVTPKSIKKSPVTPKSIKKSPVTPKSIKKSPDSPKSVKKSPGSPKSVKMSPGTSKSVKKFPGTPKSVTKSPGTPNTVSKISGTDKSLSKTSGRSSSSSKITYLTKSASKSQGKLILMAKSSIRPKSVSNFMDSPRTVKAPGKPRSMSLSPRKSTSNYPLTPKYVTTSLDSPKYAEEKSAHKQKSVFNASVRLSRSDSRTPKLAKAVSNRPIHGSPRLLSNTPERSSSESNIIRSPRSDSKDSLKPRSAINTGSKERSVVVSKTPDNTVSVTKPASRLRGTLKTPGSPVSSSKTQGKQRSTSKKLGNERAATKTPISVSKTSRMPQNISPSTIGIEQVLSKTLEKPKSFSQTPVMQNSPIEVASNPKFNSKSVRKLLVTPLSKINDSHSNQRRGRSSTPMTPGRTISSAWPKSPTNHSIYNSSRKSSIMNSSSTRKLSRASVKDNASHSPHSFISDHIFSMSPSSPCAMTPQSGRKSRASVRMSPSCSPVTPPPNLSNLKLGSKSKLLSQSMNISIGTNRTTFDFSSLKSPNITADNFISPLGTPTPLRDTPESIDRLTQQESYEELDIPIDSDITTYEFESQATPVISKEQFVSPLASSHHKDAILNSMRKRYTVKSPLKDCSITNSIQKLFENKDHDLPVVYNLFESGTPPAESNDSDDSETLILNSKSITPVAGYSEMAGVRRLLRTPKEIVSPAAEYSKVSGLRGRLSSPNVNKSPKSDFSDVTGNKKVIKTIRHSKNKTNSVNYVGLKQLLRTPRSKVLKDKSKEICQPNSDFDLIGLRKLLKSPSSKLPHIPDYTEVGGIRYLLNSKRFSKQGLGLEDLEGVRELLAEPATPVNSPIASALKDLTAITPKSNAKLTRSKLNAVSPAIGGEKQIEIIQEVLGKNVVSTSTKRARSKSTQEHEVQYSDIAPSRITPIKDSYGSSKRPKTPLTNSDHLTKSNSLESELQNKKLVSIPNDEFEQSPKKTRRGRAAAINSPLIVEISKIDSPKKVSLRGRKGKALSPLKEKLKLNSPKKVATKGHKKKSVSPVKEESIGSPAKNLTPKKLTRGRKKKSPLPLSLASNPHIKSPAENITPKKLTRGRKKKSPLPQALATTPHIETPKKTTRGRKKKSLSPLAHTFTPSIETPKKTTRGRKKKSLSPLAPLAHTFTPSIETPKKTTRGRKKKSLSPLAPLAHTFTPSNETPKKTTKGRKKKSVSPLAPTSTQSIETPKKTTRGRKKKSLSPLAHTSTPSIETPKKITRGRKKKSLTTLAQPSTPSIETPKKTTRGRKKKSLSPLAHTSTPSIETPKKITRGRKKKSLSPLAHTSTPSIETPKKTTKGRKKKSLSPLAPTSAQSIETPKKTIRGRKKKSLSPLAHPSSPSIKTPKKATRGRKKKSLSPLAHTSTPSLVCSPKQTSQGKKRKSASSDVLLEDQEVIKTAKNSKNKKIKLASPVLSTSPKKEVIKSARNSKNSKIKLASPVLSTSPKKVTRSLRSRR